MTTLLTRSRAGAPTTRLSREEIAAAAVSFGAARDTAFAAADNLTTDATILVGVSGKIASGKDTIAPLLLDLWPAGPGALRDYFANALKDEVDVLFSDIRFWADNRGVDVHNGDPLSLEQRSELAQFIAGQHNVPLAQAFDFYTGDVASQILADRTLHARLRTDAIRFALQKHGTDVRRAQDDLYWVRRTLGPAVAPLAQGTSVYFTDARFPNEVRAVQDMGGVVIRLDISPQVQRDRLAGRDGLEVTEEALTHLSETALDDFDGFDVRVDNNSTIEEAISLVKAALASIGRL